MTNTETERVYTDINKVTGNSCVQWKMSEKTGLWEMQFLMWLTPWGKTSGEQVKHKPDTLSDSM